MHREAAYAEDALHKVDERDGPDLKGSRFGDVTGYDGQCKADTKIESHQFVV